MQTNVVFRLDVSLMGVGRLRAVSFFSFESQYIESTLEKGSGGTPHNGLYGEAPPEGGTFFRFQGYERVRISRAEVHVRVRKSDIRCVKD